MAGAAILSQVEGLLEQFIEQYPEDADRVDGLLSEVRSTMEELRGGEGGEEDPMEGPPAFKSYKEAQTAAMEQHRKTGSFMRNKAKASDEDEEEQPEDDEEKKKRRAKAF